MYFYESNITLTSDLQDDLIQLQAQLDKKTEQWSCYHEVGQFY